MNEIEGTMMVEVRKVDQNPEGSQASIYFIVEVPDDPLVQAVLDAAFDLTGHLSKPLSEHSARGILESHVAIGDAVRKLKENS